MGWKGDLVDIPLGLASRVLTPRHPRVPESPRIFVLRNNDIGDLLVTTPLFEALRRRFPQCELVVGVGSWNRDTLRGNPHISEVVEVNAPWTNKYVHDFSWRNVVRYLARSPELPPLARRRFDVGIDVVGSHVGTALLMRLGIPYRLGVRGYRGGHTAVSQYVTYDAEEHVGRSALRFAELLGATSLPEVRPQIFLERAELDAGERRWTARAEAQGTLRVVLGIGAGFPEKCWPEASFAALIALLLEDPAVEIMLLGGAGDRAAGARLAGDQPRVRDLTGRLALRESFAAVAAADAMVSNSSMLMHVAAAFRKPLVTVLGPYLDDARQHHRQWGYPTARTLGIEAGHPGLATPQEALAALREVVAREGRVPSHTP